MAQDSRLDASHSETEGRASSGVASALARPIVAFDFDGTLTIRDSFTAFLKWRVGPIRYALGMANLLPAAVRYLFDRDRGRIKAAAAREFLGDLPIGRLEALAGDFADRNAEALLRPDALAAWKDWRAKGARLVIVTASPSLLVRPFAERLQADALIGTELASDFQDRLTGAFETPNCRGPEKVRRLEARFGPGLRLAAAYGDTAGDREMLAIADIAGYRVFTGRPGGGD
jgi:phosphatidylglycerophosphatase C